MRSAVWTIVGVLILGSILITLWPRMGAHDVAPSPPGQYPLNQIRFEWPVKTVQQPYRPTGGMGSDETVAYDPLDVKAKCAFAPSVLRHQSLTGTIVADPSCDY